MTLHITEPPPSNPNARAGSLCREYPPESEPLALADGARSDCATCRRLAGLPYDVIDDARSMLAQCDPVDKGGHPNWSDTAVRDALEPLIEEIERLRAELAALRAAQQ